jgi:hypothetical protein
MKLIMKNLFLPLTLFFTTAMSFGAATTVEAGDLVNCSLGDGKGSLQISSSVDGYKYNVTGCVPLSSSSTGPTCQPYTARGVVERDQSRPTILSFKNDDVVIHHFSWKQLHEYIFKSAKDNVEFYFDDSTCRTADGFSFQLTDVPDGHEVSVYGAPYSQTVFAHLAASSTNAPLACGVDLNIDHVSVVDLSTGQEVYRTVPMCRTNIGGLLSFQLRLPHAGYFTISLVPRDGDYTLGLEDINAL